MEQAKNGTISIDVDGTLIYTPNAGFIGSDSFMYQVCDNAKPTICQSATVLVKVLADRIVPQTISVDDYVAVGPNSKAQRIHKGNLIDNDYSTDLNSKLSSILVSGPTASQATFQLNENGTYIFTADPAFSGPIAIVYMLCDNSLPQNCAYATLYILVEPGDSDGDGVGDLQEAKDNTYAKDACSFKIPSQTFTPSATWANADCDGDGVTNQKEQFDETYALSPYEFVLASRTLTPSDVWRNGDFDGDGLTNDVDGFEDCDKDGILNFLDLDTCRMDILVPTVFTPNGDGINDVIKPILLGIEKFVCFKIYNRWGNIIFESKDRDRSWDGQFRTQGQSTETFTWYSEGYDREGNSVKRTGMITLLR
jgi:gliding motility-associated-like protein